jgi:Uncharacterized conserved protein (DUF2278)
VFAFGDAWGPEAKSDKIFHFRPGRGVHDVHMNQGNAGSFTRDDGVWQDGGLLFHFPDADQWVAVFLAFQSQAWHTDDATGHALSELQPGPADQPSAQEPDHTVRIVAVLPQPAAGHTATVTLLNASANAISLDGWTLLSGSIPGTPLSGTLDLGASTAVPLPGSVTGSHAGLLTLLNSAGLKVDGVAFRAEQADRPGWSVVF